METDYWRTRTIAEAQDQGYSHLRLTCACGRITDFPFPLLVQRKGGYSEYLHRKYSISV